MDSCKSNSLKFNNDTSLIDNNVQNQCSTHECDLIPSFESNMKGKVEVNKSQLLSLDGWENYQKELIRICFKFWEVSEKQVQVNNSLSSDVVSDPEIQLPTSLFADEYINNANTGFESKASLGNLDISEGLQNNESAEINGNVSAVNNDIEWQNYENRSKIVDVKEIGRGRKKILKKFSFYKHTNTKQTKANKKQQSFTFDRHASCTQLKDWRKCKKWLDTVENIKKRNPNIGMSLSDNVGGNAEKIFSDERDVRRENTTFMCSLDVEAKQMEVKIKKLIKSIDEKDKILFSNVDIINEPSSTKFGPTNKKFKYLFKKNDVFQGNQNELDLRLLNDYAEYVNRKLNTWQTLLDCLDDVGQRMCWKINTAAASCPEGAKKCKLSGTIKGHQRVTTAAAAAAANNNDECTRFKFVEINDGCAGFRGGMMNKQKKYNFFKLLNKTKSSVDMRTAAAAAAATVVKRSEQRNGVRDKCYCSCRWCKSNQICGSKKTDQNKYNSILYAANGRKICSEPIRKSFSDTDLPSMTRLYYDETRTSGAEGNEPACNRVGRKWWTAADEDECRLRCRDDVARGLWQERQECFQTVVDRLDYVGSTFKEPCRLAGLKTLCKVDVLAGFGHSAEAVDLFVSAALPLSENPDLMIRKAEAAYDWKFFCHLSMWRHSYKEQNVTKTEGDNN